MKDELTAGAAVPRLRKVTFVALLFAVAYSLALLLAGYLAPVYSTETSLSRGEISRGSATLVAENGPSVVFVLGIPLLVSLAVGAALMLYTRRGAIPIAWALTGLLALFNLLAMLSIGVFVLPVTGALIVACATSHLSHREGRGLRLERRGT